MNRHGRGERCMMNNVFDLNSGWALGSSQTA